MVQLMNTSSRDSLGVQVGVGENRTIEKESRTSDSRRSIREVLVRVVVGILLCRRRYAVAPHGRSLRVRPFLRPALILTVVCGLEEWRTISGLERHARGLLHNSERQPMGRDPREVCRWTRTAGGEGDGERVCANERVCSAVKMHYGGPSGGWGGPGDGRGLGSNAEWMCEVHAYVGGRHDVRAGGELLEGREREVQEDEEGGEDAGVAQKVVDLVGGVDVPCDDDVRVGGVEGRHD
ncbi:hypothetical protein B0H17DRAFT_1147234 [Mycena rosella]|uniref:Uncharacterized protein n=1 Tax=Mycena rosella TaxID=1033263 RepID=A0AAD7CM21_MYCRO|nr:hypothetical protein B0H17DRAFT_1147234 [Mycena rosella]